MYFNQFNNILNIACIENNLNKVILLYNEENISCNNIYDENPFMVSCRFNRIEIIKYMLDNVSKIKDNILSNFLNKVNNINENGFIIACELGHYEIIELMINYNLDSKNHIKINFNQYNCNLMNGFLYACIEEREKLIKILLDYNEKTENKINIHQKNKNGSNAYNLAFEYNFKINLNILNLLLETNIDKYNINNDNINFCDSMTNNDIFNDLRLNINNKKNHEKYNLPIKLSLNSINEKLLFFSAYGKVGELKQLINKKKYLINYFY